MSWPPMLLHIKVKNKKTNFGLWLPLFLLWPVALAFLLILSPLILIAIIVLWHTGWGKLAFYALITSIRASWCLRGLQVDVQTRTDCVNVSFI